VKEQTKKLKKSKFKGIGDKEVQQFCNENVTLTKGKSLDEVKMMMLQRK
jgi:hypothetical protein